MHANLASPHRDTPSHRRATRKRSTRAFAESRVCIVHFYVTYNTRVYRLHRFGSKVLLDIIVRVPLVDVRTNIYVHTRGLDLPPLVDGWSGGERCSRWSPGIIGIPRLRCPVSDGLVSIELRRLTTTWTKG